MNRYSTRHHFQSTDDATLVYNLMPTGRYRRGAEEMQNDIAISINARHLTDKQREDIARTICDAMNKRYVAKDNRPT